MADNGLWIGIVQVIKVYYNNLIINTKFLLGYMIDNGSLKAPIFYK